MAHCFFCNKTGANKHKYVAGGRMLSENFHPLCLLQFKRVIKNAPKKVKR